MTILDTIIANKKTELPELLGALPKFHTIEKQRPFLYDTLIHGKQLQVIAEMKRASPSKGDIATSIDPVEQALTYEKAGAACISVLTERKYFKGSYTDLNEVANAVAIPVLCKDFIIHEVQIDYAKAAGASVILLIVAALTDEELQSLYSYATKNGLEVLVEVHDEEELERALLINAKIIGVNNRNLKTFEVDLKQTEKIASALNRSDVAFISESGIWNADDASQVAGFGARAVLVGESLMRSEHVAENLQALRVSIPMKVGDSQ